MLNVQAQQAVLHVLVSACRAVLPLDLALIVFGLPESAPRIRKLACEGMSYDWSPQSSGRGAGMYSCLLPMALPSRQEAAAAKLDP